MTLKWRSAFLTFWSVWYIQLNAGSCVNYDGSSNRGWFFVTASVVHTIQSRQMGFVLAIYRTPRASFILCFVETDCSLITAMELILQSEFAAVVGTRPATGEVLGFHAERKRTFKKYSRYRSLHKTINWIFDRLFLVVSVANNILCSGRQV